MAVNPFSKKGFVRVGNEIFAPRSGRQAGKTIALETAIDALPAGSIVQRFKLSKDEDKLNKTERAYLAYLRLLHKCRIGIQDVTLKIADDCRLTVDFNYINEHGKWRFIDVKGFQREDAFIKMKVAARTFPHLEFVIVKRDGAGWSEKVISP